MRIVRVLPKVVAFMVLVVVQGCHGDAHGGYGGSGAARIYEVTDIKLNILKTNPPQLRIMAKGKVTSSGWSNPQLIQFNYIQPPPDGIYDFDFVATRPTGIVLTVISDVRTSYVVAPLPKDLKGVRIHSKRNNKVAMLWRVR